MFRVKKTKKYEQDDRATLDKLHTKHASGFDISDLRKEILQLEMSGSLSADDKKHLEELKQELEIRKEEWKRYYLENGDILTAYYDVSSQESININSFFQDHKKLNTSNPDATGGLSKEKLLEQYLIRNEKQHIPKSMNENTEYQDCPGCGARCEDQYSDGLYVCSACGTQQNVMTVSDTPSYREPHHEKHNFNYRRINHFTEIMNQIQAKETTEIPAHIMDKIQAEIKKQRITDVSRLQRDDIRAILRKIGEDDYYEHSQFIISRLTGKPPSPLPHHIVEKMNILFNEAQSLWFVHRPQHRSNFIGYNYVIYKLFELLELDEFKQYCPLLKTRDKLVEYDHVWRNICKDLRWEFIPTV
jgi:ribosomal protein L37AE/L43A